MVAAREGRKGVFGIYEFVIMIIGKLGGKC